LLTTGVGAGLKSYIDEQLATAGAENALIVTKKTEDNPFSDKIKRYDPENETASITSIPFLDQDDQARIAEIDHIQKVTPNYMVSALYVTSEYAEDKLTLSLSQSVDGLNQ